MAKGRWIKHERVNPKILEIIKKVRRHITTNEIKEKLEKEYNFRIAWITLNGYLNDLEKSNHIKGNRIEKKNIISLWQLKGD